jgi:hypothetical protein
LIANVASNESTESCAVGAKTTKPALFTRMPMSPTSYASRSTSAAAMDDDLRPFLRESLCDCTAEARRRAGDQGLLPV